jgi:hypothetical protein
MQIANVNQTVADVIAISEMIKNDADLKNKLQKNATDFCKILC